MSGPTHQTPDAAPDCAEGVLRHAVREHTHRAMQGYWLLRARLTHMLPAASRGVKKVSSELLATVASNSPAAEPPGFEQWLREHITDARIMSQRTAYNYMGMALKCGILPTMTEDEALAIAAEKLSGLTSIKSLYGPEPTTATPAQREVPVDEDRQLQQGWLDFMGRDFALMFAPEGKHLRVLARMEIAEIEAQHRRLVAAQEAVARVLETRRAAGKGGRP